MKLAFAPLLIALLAGVAGCAADKQLSQDTEVRFTTRAPKLGGQTENVEAYYGQAAIASIELTGPEFPERLFRIVNGVCEDTFQQPGFDLLISVGHTVSNIVARSPLDADAMKRCRPEVSTLQKFSIDIKAVTVAKDRATLLIGVKDLGNSTANVESVDLQLGHVHKIAWHQGFVSVRLDKLLLADGSEVVAPKP